MTAFALRHHLCIGKWQILRDYKRPPTVSATRISGVLVQARAKGSILTHKCQACTESAGLTVK